MSRKPKVKDPQDFSKPLFFTPNREDAERLRMLHERTGLRGAALVRFMLAQVARAQVAAA